MVKDDYCSKCSMPLAEMRVLASIDANVRSELKLGESPRALAEMEIKRLEYLLQTDSGNAEKYMFELAMVHKGINFYSRESAIWLDFLKKFPNSEKAQEASLYGSESLCKWSYLFYSQGLYDSALELINESLRLNPGNKEAGRWLKITRAAMKKTAHVPAKAVRETEPEKKAEPAAGSSEAAVQQQ
jgi:tetratricopeptide (TPR) repeat protein